MSESALKDVHRFDCKDGHTFYIPLNLPMDVRKFADMCLEMQCPRCGMRSKGIHVDARKYMVVNMERREEE